MNQEKAFKALMELIKWWHSPNYMRTIETIEPVIILAKEAMQEPDRGDD